MLLQCLADICSQWQGQQEALVCAERNGDQERQELPLESPALSVRKGAIGRVLGGRARESKPPDIPRAGSDQSAPDSLLRERNADCQKLPRVQVLVSNGLLERGVLESRPRWRLTIPGSWEWSASLLEIALFE